MEFFLTLIMVYPQDQTPKRFYYSYANFAECLEARRAFTQPNPANAPRVISAVCTSGKAPPPTPEQSQEDEAILRAMRDYFKQ